MTGLNEQNGAVAYSLTPQQALASHLLPQGPHTCCSPCLECSCPPCISPHLTNCSPLSRRHRPSFPRPVPMTPSYSFPPTPPTARLTIITEQLFTQLLHAPRTPGCCLQEPWRFCSLFQPVHHPCSACSTAMPITHSADGQINKLHLTCAGLSLKDRAHWWRGHWMGRFQNAVLP